MQIKNTASYLSTTEPNLTQKRNKKISLQKT